MKFQFFMISAIAPDNGQQKLNAFCAQHHVISVEKQMIEQGNNSFWSMCVCYIEGEQSGANETSKASAKRGRIDYKETLSEEEFSIYAALRNLRKTLADRESVPVYALFTNEQLAEMVTQQVTTLSNLANIAGVGKARLDKYGEPFIAELKRLFATQSGNNETLSDSNS